MEVAEVAPRVGVGKLVDDDRNADELAAAVLDEPASGAGLGARLEPVIDEDDPVADTYGVPLDPELEFAPAIVAIRRSFQLFARQHAAVLADGDEANAEFLSDGGSENEAPGFDPDDLGHRSSAERFG
jgi:hypothetical protein